MLTGVPILDALVRASAPNAAAHPAPARAARIVVVTRLVDVTLEALRAAIAVSAAVAATFPLVGAGYALGFLFLRDVGTLAIVVIRALSAVDVVLARVSPHVCAFVKWYQCVRCGSVALFTARNQLFTCLTAELSEPVAIVALARAVPILAHVWEDTILNVTSARAILLH